MSIPRRFAFYLMSSITVSFLASASAPTPLYPTYQAQWGFSSLSVTEIFAVYALAVLASLLVFGRLSDHVGRKPVLLTAIVVQALTMCLFATAGGLGALLLARVIQGLATGAAIAAIGAGLLDIDKRRGALANAITTPTGTAVGGVVAGLVVSLLPLPTQLVYLLMAGIFVLQGVAVLAMDETATLRPGALASLRPQFILSQGTRSPMLHGAPIIIATWAVAGFFASLGPAMVKTVLGVNSSLLSGLALFTMAGSGALFILLLRDQTPRLLMRAGVAALGTGVLGVVAALSLHNAVLFFAGLVVTGIGFGSGFQGALRSIVSQAHADERAGVLSVIFVIAYLAMGLPAMGAGLLLAHGTAMLHVAAGFTALIALLTLIPLALSLAARPIVPRHPAIVR